MPKETQKLIFDVAIDLLGKIDDYRFEHRKLSRAEAIRELIKKGLDQEENHNEKTEKRSKKAKK